MKRHSLLQRYRRERRPTEDQADALVHRVEQEIPSSTTCRAMLQHLSAPSAQSQQALLRRVAHTQDRILSKRKARFPVWAPASVALLTAVILLMVISTQSTPLNYPLRAPTEVVHSQPLTGIELHYQGEGAVEGETRAPVIQWETGTLRVSVRPGTVAELSVQTPDATVRVLGTVFTVTRDALGTRVEVERGSVETQCASGKQRILQAGEDHRCWPDSPAGLVRRARSLQNAGRSASEILATADRGLACQSCGDLHDPAQSVLQGELRVIRLTALIELGRHAEALEEADRYLATPGAIRRGEVLEQAVKLAGTADDCHTARPYLEALVREKPRASHLVRLADCLANTDPARARTLLKAALDLPLSTSSQENIRIRLDRLLTRESPSVPAGHSP